MCWLRNYADLRIRTQMATKEYASRVPIDMRSTRAPRSNRKAIRAVKGNHSLEKQKQKKHRCEVNIHKLKQTNSISHFLLYRRY